jgi:hypothetical protein
MEVKPDPTILPCSQAQSCRSLSRMCVQILETKHCGAVRRILDARVLGIEDLQHECREIRQLCMCYAYVGDGAGALRREWCGPWYEGARGAEEDDDACEREVDADKSIRGYEINREG